MVMLFVHHICMYLMWLVPLILYLRYTIPGLFVPNVDSTQSFVGLGSIWLFASNAIAGYDIIAIIADVKNMFFMNCSFLYISVPIIEQKRDGTQDEKKR